MNVISVIQQKGGVGKTTIAVHLAYEIKAMRPKANVVIADADPQGSATKWIERGKANGIEAISVVQIATDGEGKKLKKEIQSIKADFVIVDLPPAIASVSLRAALYGDLLLVPVGASALDIESAKVAIGVCEEAVELSPKKLFFLVPSKVQLATGSGRELNAVLRSLGPVSKTPICQRIAFADAAGVGVGIGMYSPNSVAHQEIQTLAKEVLSRLKGRGRNGS